MTLLRLCFVLIILNSTLFAYLDPSTGSLLLSSVVALFASLIFLLKNIYYKLLNLLQGGGGYRKDKNSHGIVFYSEGKQYYGVFAPILDTLDEWKYPYIFLTSDKDDPAFKRAEQESVKFIGESNKAYAYLNTLKADLLVMTTPGLDVLQIKKTKRIKHYCHIVHSLGSPNYRVFGMDYFDSILINSSIQEDFVRKLENMRDLPHKQIVNVGSTYCDYLFALKEKVLKEGNKVFFPNREEKKVILLSPSWGKEGILSKYGMHLIRPILDSGYLLIIRPHPQSMIVEKEVISNLQKQIQDNPQVAWDIGTPNVYAMQESDVMISDFSGVIFDYLCLYQKPVLSVEYDFDNSGYDSADLGGIWEFGILEKIGGRIPSNSLDQIVSFISEALESRENTQAIQEAIALLWQHPHCSGVLGAKALLNLREEVLEESLASAKETCEQIFKIREILRSKQC